MAEQDNQSANQVPQVASTTVVKPIVVTCADVSKSGSPGPIAGRVRPAIISPADIIDDRQELWKSGVRIGFTDEFVEFDNGQFIVKEVAVYLRAMIDAANQEGVLIWTSSGFRTFAKQEELVREKGLASEGGLAAAAGYSNHQNGIAVDFDIVRDNGKPFEWLVMNAWKYGFIRTVAKERWHWEYWGNWIGQERPRWANHLAWGDGIYGHRPRAMFSVVGRVHACGERETGGGTYPMKTGNWWSTYYSNLTNHSDFLTGGKTNSWIGYGNTHLPDKFDLQNHLWDT